MNLSLSFIRGMLAAVNPCGFVLLPTYLFYFLGMTSGATSTERASIRRALLVSGAVSSGFIAVFLVIGLITDQLTTWIVSSAKYATAVIGVAFLLLGVAMLFGYKLPIFTPKLDAGGRERTVRSMFVYGVAYAVASLGCTLPLFMTVLFGTADREGLFAGLANVLAYGVQRRLAVGIALMNDPRLLFLDEPAAGMNGKESADFVELVRAIEPGRTIVIVEHDMTVISALCRRTLVMVDGRPVTVGPPGEVFRHPEVIEAYLGADDE